MYGSVGIFSLFVVIMNRLLRVLTQKINTSVRHTVIKACNNKIEQGGNIALFSVCVCFTLGGEKSFFITFTVNSQCLIAAVRLVFRES